jgi:hypothetical protein
VRRRVANGGLPEVFRETRGTSRTRIDDGEALERAMCVGLILCEF